MSGSEPNEPALVDAEREPSLLRALAPKVLISLVLGGVFFFIVRKGGVPFLPSKEGFGLVQPWAIPVYVVTLLAMHFFRASRWRFLIAPVKKVPFKDVIFLNWIGFFAIFALPLRIGEFARPILTKVRQGISISVGVGTVAVERVVDGLLTSFCVAYAVFALPRLPSDDPLVASLPFYAYLFLGVFVAAFAGLMIFLLNEAFATRLIGWTFGLVSKSFGDKLRGKVADVADGCRSLLNPRLAFGFLFESMLYWGFNALGMWLLAVGCGMDTLQFGHGVALMGILAIGILLPAGPGLFGNFQLAISLGLKLFLADAIVGVQGATYIFLLYSIQSIVLILTGVLPLLAMKIPFSYLIRPPRVAVSD